MSISMSKKANSNQKGMVSIIVTMIMLIVITLIVVGFSIIARRDQRQALDRQLSTQAFYAAETGVNDVLKIYNTPSWNPPTTSSCSGAGSVLGSNPSLNSTIDNTLGVRYTCLIVTDKLSSIIESVPLEADKVVQINPVDGAGNPAPTDLTFTWQSAGGGGSAATCPTAATNNKFDPQPNWLASCPYGILRLDLFDSSSNPTNPGAMASATEVFYLVPSPVAASNVSFSFGGGKVAQASCSGGTCSATLRTSAFASTNYYARMSALYEDLGNVTITPGSASFKFSNAGLMVDATGQAQDQVRRIQVRVKSTNSSGVIIPPAALGSAGQICKQFTIEGAGTSAQPDWNSPTPLCQ